MHFLKTKEIPALLLGGKNVQDERVWSLGSVNRVECEQNTLRNHAAEHPLLRARAWGISSYHPALGHSRNEWQL